jgi:predicted translin family RNA/ssDNA-binding protein
LLDCLHTGPRSELEKAEAQLEKAEADLKEAKADVKKWEDKLEKGGGSAEVRIFWKERLAAADAHRRELERHLQELRMALVTSAPAHHQQGFVCPSLFRFNLASP